MTKNTHFSDFLNSYIREGLSAVIIITVCSLIFAPLIFSNQKVTSQKKMNFYSILEGGEITDSTAYQAVTIIRQMTDNDSALINYYQDQQYLVGLIDSLQAGIDSNSVLVDMLTDPEEIHENLEEMKSIFSSDEFFRNYFKYQAKLIDLNYEITFTELLTKNKDLIFGIVRGDSIAPVINVPTWGGFWKRGGIIIYCISIFAFFLFLTYTLIEKNESYIIWPWKKFWVYPTILVMSPAVLPCIIIEIVFRLIFSPISNDLKGVGRVIREAYNTSPSERSIAKTIEIKKQEARRQIQSVQQRTDQIKQKFVEYSLKDIKYKVSKLRNDAQERRRDLSELGQKIAWCQEDLAKTEQELREHEDGYEKYKEKVAANYKLDFERLLKLKLVQAVDMERSTLKIYTDVIYIKRGMGKYEIGIFIIKIGLDTDYIELENLSSTHASGDFHPYGRRECFCWGVLGPSIESALRKREYAVAIEFILQALQSYKGDNEGAEASWKEV